MTHPFLALLQIALIGACVVVELHPRIRTGGIACLVLGGVSTYTVIHWDAPASLLEYLLTALTLLIVLIYAWAKHTPSRPHAGNLGAWHITP